VNGCNSDQTFNPTSAPEKKTPLLCVDAAWCGEASDWVVARKRKCGEASD